jgi:RNA polymerase subunit RPABC4/transcription elongation factor Spt4
VPIQLVCPNGHRLTAKESNAGKTGKCPVCKAAVRIPPKKVIASDSVVMSILGDASAPKQKLAGTKIVLPKKNVPAATAVPKNADSFNASVSSSSAMLPHLKVCPNCEREIDMGYHICPHCHTYITGLNDF